MTLSYACLDMLSLTGTLVAPQSDEKNLCWFRIVWSHIPQYQKFGVRKISLIPPSCLIVCYQAYFQCNIPWIILIYLVRISQWPSQIICLFDLACKKSLQLRCFFHKMTNIISIVLHRSSSFFRGKHFPLRL